MYEHLLLPLDGSKFAECVIPHAIAVARTFQSRVTLARVLEPNDASGAPTDPLDWQMHRAESLAYLDEMCNQLRRVEVPAVGIVLEGNPGERIVEYSQEQGANLILLSSHGRSGFHAWTLSGVAQKVVFRTHTSVMIIRAYETAPSEGARGLYRRILVAADGSLRAESAIPPATALARAHDSDVFLAQVVARPELPRRAPLTPEDAELSRQVTERNRVEGERCLEELLAKFTTAEVPARTRLLLADDPAAALHELVAREDIDLVVLSAHGYTGGTKWLHGSVALRFIYYGTSTLLIVQDLTSHEIKPTPAELAGRERKGH